MTPAQEDLARRVADEVRRPVDPVILAAAGALAAATPGALCVLFYGSVLRTRDPEGVADFYVLTGRPQHRSLRALVERWLWPAVDVRSLDGGSRAVMAKIAVMPLDVFEQAASGERVDTTIWTRFVQPCALVWAAGSQVSARVEAAIGSAQMTAARFAAALGPSSAPPLDFWRALFAQTYRAELRVERPGREAEILRYDPDRYADLLVAAWRAAGLAVSRDASGEVAPHLPAGERARLLRAWRLRRTMGKSLNAARLVKAAFTFKGAARYAVWKIERHTGVAIRLTPFRERHPVLAAPGVLFLLWRARRRQARQG